MTSAMQIFRYYGRHPVWCGALTLILFSPTWLNANEIAPFRITDVEGDVGISYQSDELLTGPVDQNKTSNELNTTRQDIYILTHSYIYHPNLLGMDLGIGLSYVQSELETTAGNAEVDDDLDTLTVKLRFLEKKPYPFMFYFDRTNPMVSPSLTERFVQENENYGLKASLNQPLLPFSVNLEAFHTSNKGSGLTRIVDDTTDQVILRAYRTIGEDGYGQFTYHVNERESASGINTQAINTTDITSESTSFDSHFSFGTTNQFRLSNLVSYFLQDNLPEQKEFRFVPNLTWQHDRDFSTYYRLDYLNNEIDSVEAQNTSVAVGGRKKQSEAVATTSELHASKNKISGVEAASNGLAGSVSYLQPFKNGRLSMSMNLAYDRNSRTQGTVTIYREAVRLETDVVALLNQFVDDSSITVVNATNQTMQPGVDYRVIRVGNITQVERIIGGGIDFGETVYVSYQYQSDANVVYAVFNQSYNVTLDFFKYYSLYTEYSDSDLAEREGVSSQLTDVRRNRSGFRFEQPFAHDTFTVGGEAVHEEQHDDNSPYKRKTLQLYFDTEVYRDTRLRLSARTVQQDNLLSVEDVDLERQSARLVTRPWPRSTLSFEVRHEKDIGGTINRRVKEHSIVGRWRIRKLVFEVDGRSITEIQDDSEREHKLLTAKLNREF